MSWHISGFTMSCPLTVSIITITCSKPSVSRQKIPVAENGILDLTQWNFPKDGTVLLNGEWEFYWGQLLTPEDFQGSDLPDKTGFFKVPKVWNNHNEDTRTLAGKGHATYRLIIKLGKPLENYGFKLSAIITAYQLWIDDGELCNNGKVGTTEASMTPQFRPQIATFHPHNSTVQIILQVSNYYHKNGGFYRPIEFGLEDQIRKARENRVTFELFLFGSILIMAFYHFSLFLLRRYDRYILLFGLICLIISIRILVSGEHLLTSFIPGFPWMIHREISYLTIYTTIPLFGLFIQSLYPDEFSRKVLQVTILISTFFCLSVLMTHSRIFTALLIYYQFFIVLFSIYIAHVLISAFQYKRQGATSFIICFLFLFASVVNDILHDNRIIQTSFLAPLGIYLFIFAQSFILSQRYSNSFKAIEKLEEKFRSLFEDSLDAIFITNGKGDIININKAGLDMFGVSEDEAMSRNVNDYYVNKEDRSVFLTHMAEHGYVKDFVADFYHKDGKISTCMVSSTMNITREGKRHFRSIVRDITDQVRAKQQTEEALQKAQQANRVKSLFLENMSHEIRTPLNAVLGFTDLIEDRLKDKISREEHEFFEGIRSGGNRIIRTVHEILDISQLEAGTFQLHKEIFQLKDLAEKLIKEQQPVADSKNLELLFNSNAGNTDIAADQRCIYRALGNLVDNAVKYTETGTISVSLIKKNGTLDLIISDTGIGMSAEYQKTMFSIFSQESTGYTKKFQGIGLGLALTKRYLDINEVSIDVKSKKGKGTVFTLGFGQIVNAETDEVERKSREEQSAIRSKATSEKPTILVVEDDRFCQQLISFFLKKSSNLLFAVSVREARERLETENINLILLDLSLEGDEDGLNLARNLRETSEWQDIPIIATTAHAFTTDRKNCLAAGCNDYLSKPIKQQALIKTINKFIADA